MNQKLISDEISKNKKFHHCPASDFWRAYCYKFLLITFSNGKRLPFVFIVTDSKWLLRLAVLTCLKIRNPGDFHFKIFFKKSKFLIGRISAFIAKVN